jgi:DNA mismatch repair protein MutS
MMQQFTSVKNEHPDAILFFRVGDFYETFYDDAVTASRELEIALTSRDGNKEDAVPLAGVPYHAAQNYIARLLEKGYKVAICDQVEEASQAKGLVKREVTRVITPGTIMDDNLLPKDRNNYLAAISKKRNENSFGLTFVDISTGECQVFYFDEKRAADKVFDKIYCLRPTEIVIDEFVEDDNLCKLHLQKQRELFLINKKKGFSDHDEPLFILKEQFSEAMLEMSGITSVQPAFFSAALALEYIKKMQKVSLAHISDIKFYRYTDSLTLDAVTARNLEIFETIRSREKKNALLGLLDRTKTAMGARLLRKWLEKPLLERESMELRWEAVGELKEKQLLKEDLAGILKQSYDLERLSGRINMGLVNPRDLLALKKTLLLLPQVKLLLEDHQARLLKLLSNQIPDLSHLVKELDSAIKDDAPFSLKEGGIFKEGYCNEIDELRQVSKNSKLWLLDMEKKEKERTGIKSLKIGFNKVFGYYIEITRANLELVPAGYIRKQTLVNCERYITEELKEKESLILNAEEKLAQLEYELFEKLRLNVAQYIKNIQTAGQVLANLDCLFSLADTASVYGYIKPRFSSDKTINIKGGRHPVVERVQEELFIPNDVFLDGERQRILIITGPNMAGKSTYCRSIALLLIMAQIGSFVPAEDMSFSPVDHIFARVGASDDLSSGRSTFMVEMEETASILRDATPDSLVILDEIGRGTSTYDGMSLAQAILEYLHNDLKAKVLFSTHYHELTALEDRLSGIKNFTVSVKEKGEEVIFLRKIVPGKADKSYGVNVARLAGLPVKIINRACQVLENLETKTSASKIDGNYPAAENHSPDNPFYLNFESFEGQLSFLPSRKNKDASLNKKEEKVIQEIRELNVVNITPLEALKKLFSLQSRLLSKENPLREKER